MDRRAITGSLFGIVLAGGIAALIAIPALPSTSPYINLLLIGGVTAIVIGTIGLLALLIFQPKKPVVTDKRPRIDLTDVDAKLTDNRYKGEAPFVQAKGGKLDASGNQIEDP